MNLMTVGLDVFVVKDEYTA